MSRSQYGPAAGSSGGALPRLADLRAPPFIRFNQSELNLMYHVIRDSLVTQLYGLLCIHSDFKTGELLTTYARLMELCTPPQPERGKRRASPSYWQLRRAIDDLANVNLVLRASGNEEQGQLRLYIQPRDSKAPPDLLARRIRRRDREAAK